jgi:hypothetical protein
MNLVEAMRAGLKDAMGRKDAHRLRAEIAVLNDYLGV